MGEPQCPQCREYVKIIEELRSQIDKMRVRFESEIKTLKEEISHLKNQLSQNSRNSSKPPSSDGFKKPAPRSLRRRGERPRGGQKGHTGKTLKMSDNPDHTKVYGIDQCERCGHSLEEEQARNVEKRQVFDLPPCHLEVTEHQALTTDCPYCGFTNKASFPEDVNAPVQYGPYIRSMAVYLLQYQLLPFERTGELMEDIFSIPMSTGTLVNMVEDCSDRVREPVERIREEIGGSPIAHFDESGVSVNGVGQWFHVASTEQATYYGIHSKRGSDAMDEMGILPGFCGRAIHDFWKSYFGYPCDHGMCNAHLLRELIFVHEELGQQWAKKMIKCLLDIKELVDETKLNNVDSISPEQIKKCERQYWRILKMGDVENPLPPVTYNKKRKRGRPKKSKPRNLLERFQDYQKEILAFMYDFSVPFDNNLAERDIRMIKVRLKISGTFRSTAGGKAFCRIRSYISTARKNAINVIEAIQGAFAGKPFVPQPSPGT